MGFSWLVLSAATADDAAPPATFGLRLNAFPVPIELDVAAAAPKLKLPAVPATCELSPNGFPVPLELDTAAAPKLKPPPPAVPAATAAALPNPPKLALPTEKPAVKAETEAEAVAAAELPKPPKLPIEEAVLTGPEPKAPTAPNAALLAPLVALLAGLADER